MKSSSAKGRLFFLYFDVLDARAGWSDPDLFLESFDGVSFAFRERLDAAVDQVADPATQLFTKTRLTNKVPETDSLHSATNEISAYDLHGSYRR